jgi:hypothetical protein
MKNIAAVCCLLGCFTSLSSAQGDARVVKFRVLCYEHARDTLKGFVSGEGGGRDEVTFYTGGFGPQTSGKFADGKARFFIEKPGPDGKPVPTVVAEGKLGPSAVQVFLLFPEAKDSALVYKVVAFDDLETSFPMGSTRVINLATFPIRLSLAGTEMPPIKPGGLQVYPQVKQVDDWNMFSARIDFGVGEDKWVPVATQSWKASDRKRDWVITHIDPNTKEPALRLYQDIPPWREAKLAVGTAGAGGKTP